MIDDIIELFEFLGIDTEEYIKVKWWKFYNRIDKKQNTEKYIFYRKIYPVFTGLKFQLGEKE